MKKYTFDIVFFGCAFLSIMEAIFKAPPIFCSTFIALSILSLLINVATDLIIEAIKKLEVKE